MRDKARALDNYLFKEKLRNIASIMFMVIPLLALVSYFLWKNEERELQIYHLEGELLELAGMQSKYKHTYSYKVRLETGHVVLADSVKLLQFSPGDKVLVNKSETMNKDRYRYYVVEKANGS